MSKSFKTPEKKLTAAERLKQYNLESHAGHKKESDEILMMKRLFSQRSAHLPGYNWCQDWVQWMLNNHPLLGLCCRHRLNPIGIAPRLVIILSSISFGLIATNVVFLFYRYYDANGIILKLELGGGEAIAVTYETIALWTLGGLLHSLTDLGMWHLTACACCLPGAGCYKICGCLARIGPYAAILIAASLSAGATFAILMRASYEERTGGANEINDDKEWKTVDDLESFTFLYSYLIELILVYFVYYPLMATVFFSGAVWGCLPCIGGRPKEIQRQRDEKMKNNTNSNRETFDDDMV